jgi:hypothetical protein
MEPDLWINWVDRLPLRVFLIDKHAFQNETSSCKLEAPSVPVGGPDQQPVFKKVLRHIMMTRMRQSRTSRRALACAAIEVAYDAETSPTPEPKDTLRHFFTQVPLALRPARPGPPLRPSQNQYKLYNGKDSEGEPEASGESCEV